MALYKLDIDGNELVETFNDALLLLRFTQGQRGQDLTDGATGVGTTRSISEIEDYLTSAIKNGGFDANEDGVVNEDDAFLILVYLLNKENNDGTVNISELDASYERYDKNGLTTQQIADNIAPMLTDLVSPPQPTIQYKHPLPEKISQTQFPINFNWNRDSVGASPSYEEGENPVHRPDYGSSLEFVCENSMWYGQDYEVNIMPRGLNSIKANINLKYTNYSNSILQITKKLEEIQSKNKFKFNSEAGTYDYSADLAASGGGEYFNFSDSFRLHDRYYNNFSGSILENFSVEDLGDRLFRLNVNLYNDRVSPFFLNGNGFVKDFSTPISLEKDYKKFDLITADSNTNKFDNYFYCKEDISLDDFSGFVKPLSGLSTYTGEFQNFTRTFFFQPDQAVKLDFDTSNDIVKYKGSISTKENISNNSLLLKTFDLKFSNRSEKETKAMLHFFESHMGYKTFCYKPCHPIISDSNKGRVFICDRWKHTFNYEDSNDIEATFKEIPNPKNIFVNNSVEEKTSAPQVIVEAFSEILKPIRIVITNQNESNIINSAYSWELREPGGSFSNSIYPDNNKDSYLIKGDEGGSGIRGKIKLFNENGEEFNFVTDEILVEDFQIIGEPKVGQMLRSNLDQNEFNTFPLFPVGGAGQVETVLGPIGSLGSSVDDTGKLLEIFTGLSIEEINSGFFIDTSDNLFTVLHAWQGKPIGAPDSEYVTIFPDPTVGNTESNKKFRDYKAATGYLIEEEDENKTFRLVTLGGFDSTTDLGNPKMVINNQDNDNGGEDL